MNLEQQVAKAWKRGWIRNVAILGIPIALISGCLSMQSQPSAEALQGAGAQPIVEAFIEYPGPHEKWAGPTGLILHVSAKENSGIAQITTTPEWFATPAVRKPATAVGLTAIVARDRLARLNEAIQGDGAAFRGCLSPIRVRLIRANGALSERLGCRSGRGWPQAVGDTLDYFMSAAVFNAPPSR